MCGTMTNTILERRSIRAYKDKKIPKPMLEQVLEYGFAAPSARNMQPWHVSVVEDADIIGSMNQGVIDVLSKDPNMNARVSAPGFNTFHGAQQLLLVSADKANSWAKADCGMLTQNLLLAAHEMGLGTCVVGFVMSYLGSAEGKSCVDKLVPEGFEPFYAITIGFPAEHPEAKPRENKSSWF